LVKLSGGGRDLIVGNSPSSKGGGLFVERVIPVIIEPPLFSDNVDFSQISSAWAKPR
jgi:hypothetical protein